MNGLSGLFSRGMPGMQMDPRMLEMLTGRPQIGGSTLDQMRAPGQPSFIGPGGVPPTMQNATPEGMRAQQAGMPSLNTPGAPIPPPAQAPQAPQGGGFMGNMRENLQKPGTMNLAAGMIGAALAPRSQMGGMVAGGMAGASAANQKAEQAKGQQAMMQRQMQRQQMMDSHNIGMDRAKLGLQMQKQNPGELPKAPENIDWENPAQVGAYLQSDPRLRPIFESWAKRQGGGVPGFF